MAVWPETFCARTVKRKVPGKSGVPAITPLEAKVMPGGNVPSMTDQVVPDVWGLVAKA
jgi:hypothetical protein